MSAVMKFIFSRYVVFRGRFLQRFSSNKQQHILLRHKMYAICFTSIQPLGPLRARGVVQSARWQPE
jgi:hypothetical protein